MNLTPAEGWRPHEGAVLIGTVERIDAAWSDYIGGYYPLVVVAPDDGSASVAVHCFHDILRKRMMLLKPRVGERIGIKYHGQTKTQDGKRTVSQYTVKIDGRDSDADVWGAMSDPTPRPQTTPTQQQQAFEERTDNPTTDDIPF